MSDKINNEWKDFLLEELGTIVGGSTPSTKNAFNYMDGKIPWITPKDLSTHKERYISHGERNITQIGLESCSTQLLPKNTVLFSSRAPIGYIAISSNEVCTNQGFKSIIPNKNINYMFLYYLLKHNKENIENIASGTTFKEVSGKTMGKFKVTIPSLPTQRRIASILSALDDKIELNNRMNKNLEEQARAIYKSWFVDFEPWGGVMPSDWRIGKASEIIELHDSKRIPISNFERAKLKKIYPYYGATSIMDYVDNYIFDGIYLLFAEDGTVVDSDGHPILQYVNGKFWVNNHAHILTGSNGFSTEMLFILFGITNITSIITGAVQPKINQANLNNIEVVIPCREATNRLNNIIQPIFAQIRANQQESRHLAALRDTLLPKLMSGELDVSEVRV